MRSLRITTYSAITLVMMLFVSVSNAHAQVQGTFQGGSWLDAYVIIQQSVTPIGGSVFQQNAYNQNYLTATPLSNDFEGNIPTNQNQLYSSVDNQIEIPFQANTTQFSSQSSTSITSGVPNNSGSCSTNFVTVLDILLFFKCIISVTIIPLLFAIALSVFIFGIIKYIRNAEDSKKREEGRDFMIYGIVSIFVIVSMWGLVGFLRNTFFSGNAGQIVIPAPRQQSPQ